MYICLKSCTYGLKVYISKLLNTDVIEVDKAEHLYDVQIKGRLQNIILTAYDVVLVTPMDTKVHCPISEFYKLEII